MLLRSFQTAMVFQACFSALGGVVQPGPKKYLKPAPLRPDTAPHKPPLLRSAVVRSLACDYDLMRMALKHAGIGNACELGIVQGLDVL